MSATFAPSVIRPEVSAMDRNVWLSRQIVCASPRIVTDINLAASGLLTTRRGRPCAAHRFQGYGAW
jgi:hypothetical protein